MDEGDKKISAYLERTEQRVKGLFENMVADYYREMRNLEDLARKHGVTQVTPSNRRNPCHDSNDR